MKLSARTIALLLFAFAFSLRVIGWNGPLWFDEIQFLVELVRFPLVEALGHYGSDNNHPLYTLCTWLSVRIFGESPWALRLPAALFGAAATSALYLLLSRRRLPTLGIASALLLAVSSHAVWFSQNARGYTALLFFTITATDAYFRSQETGRSLDLLRHGAALALASFSHLTGVYVALAHAVVSFATWCLRRDRRTAADHPLAPLGGVLLAGAISALLHAPMLPSMIRFFFGWDSETRVRGVWRSFGWMFEAAASGFGVSPIVFGTLFVLGATLGLAALVRLGRAHRALPWLFVLPGVFGLVASVALSRNLWPRFFFFLSGFAIVVVVEMIRVVVSMFARGRLSGHARSITGVLIVLTAVALAFRLPRVWFTPKQDFEAARRYVLEHKKPQDEVLTVGLAIQPYAWLYDASFRAVRSLEELEAQLEGGRTPWVLSTIPIFLQSQTPDLAAALENRFEVRAKIPSSIDDGEITVYTLKP